MRALFRLAAGVAGLLLVEANKIRDVDVISMQDIEAVLGLEQQKTLLGCDDVVCMAEIGGALSVQAIVSSKVARVGETYNLRHAMREVRHENHRRGAVSAANDQSP